MLEHPPQRLRVGRLAGDEVAEQRTVTTLRASPADRHGHRQHRPVARRRRQVERRVMALPQSKLHVAPVTNTHQKVGKTKTRGRRGPGAVHLAGHSRRPRRAAQLRAQQPEVASSTADSTIGVLPSPALTDGYLR